MLMQNMEIRPVLQTALPAEKVTTNIPLHTGDLLPPLEVTVPSDLWLSIVGTT